VPMALVLTSTLPPVGVRPVIVLGVAAALLSTRVYDVRGLSLLNVIGAAVAMLALMRWYLPLESSAVESRADAGAPAGVPSRPS